MDIPVYLFTGFLESGKTRFIQETLEDQRFNNGEKTLLLLCEEGVEEYDPARFFGKNVFIEPVQEESDEHEEAANHPGDKGMAAIAERILKTV